MGSSSCLGHVSEVPRASVANNSVGVERHTLIQCRRPLESLAHGRTVIAREPVSATPVSVVGGPASV